MNSKTRMTAPLGVVLLSMVAGIASADALNDAQILGIYIQVNSFDIETALLGSAKADSESVRTLADQVAKDHVGVRQAAYDLGAKCKVVPTLPETRTTSAIKHGIGLSRLLSLKGAEFDKAYAAHEAEFHREAIAAVRMTLLPNAKCPDLIAHFKEILPAFEHHLAATDSVAKKIGAP